MQCRIPTPLSFDRDRYSRSLTAFECEVIFQSNSEWTLRRSQAANQSTFATLGVFRPGQARPGQARTCPRYSPTRKLVHKLTSSTLHAYVVTQAHRSAHAEAPSKIQLYTMPPRPPSSCTHSKPIFWLPYSALLIRCASRLHLLHKKQAGNRFIGQLIHCYS